MGGRRQKKISIEEAIEVRKRFNRFKDVFKKAEDAFDLDFRYEKRFTEKESTEEIKPRKPKSSDKKDRLASFKKLRNTIAKRAHPDVCDSPEQNDDFNLVQEAYMEGDLLELCRLAQKYEVDFSLIESDLEGLRSECQQQLRQMNRFKKSLAWHWLTGRRNKSAREKVWKTLKIDPEEFEAWLSAYGVTTQQLREESIARRPLHIDVSFI